MLKEARGRAGIWIAKTFLCLFALFGTLMAGVVIWSVTVDIVAVARSRAWPGCECRVLSSHIRTSEGMVEPEVRYAYRWDDQEFTSSQVTLLGSRSDDYATIAKLVDSLSDAKVCYVNPSLPSQAILIHDSWQRVGALLVILIIFVGFCCFLSVFWTRLSGTPIPDVPFVVVLNLFGVLICLMAYYSSVQPAFASFAARSWTSVPCRILEADIHSQRGSKGRVYRLDIMYEYEVDGRRMRSNRYDLHEWGGLSSNYSRRERILKNYPAGSESVCFVNPKDSYHAVLDRSCYGQTGPFWFWGMLVFALFGGSILILALVSIWARIWARCRLTASDQHLRAG